MDAGKKRVAVFEDNAVDRFIYQRNLSLLHNSVEYHIFHDANAGIEAIERSNFDIVIINLHFWTTNNGLNILEALRDLCDPATTFIAVTPLLQQGDVERTLSGGFLMCLEKAAIFRRVNKMVIQPA